jgi:myo-inositol-1(or 4)-monophosphatase
MNAIEQRYAAAIGIAREAGDLARRYFVDRDGLEVSFKGPQDFLTSADGAVERLIVGRLNRAFPGDACLGEEGGGVPGAVTWVIDPIDGTANFARGIAHFCVSISLAIEGRIEVGVIAHPMADEMYVARRGHGASLNGRPLTVSTTSTIEHAVIELGWSKRRPMEDYLRIMAEVVRAGASFRRAGSGALGLAHVAAGRSDGYFERHINSWDCLAGILLVDEAGGWTNDFLAGNGMTEGNPVLAVAPQFRDTMMRLTGIER